MAIKVNGETVIHDSKKGSFQSVNPGVYPTASRPANPSEGDVIYDSDESSLLVWNGTEWGSAGSGGANTFYLFKNGETSSSALSYTLDLRPYQKIISVSTLICTKGDKGAGGTGWYWCGGTDYGSNGGQGGSGGAIYSDIRTYDGVGYPTSITFSSDNTTVEGYTTATRLSGERTLGGRGGRSCNGGSEAPRYGARNGESTTGVVINGLEPYKFYIQDITGNSGGAVNNSIHDGRGYGGGGGAGFNLVWQPYTQLFSYTGTQNGPGFGGGGSGGAGDTGSANSGNGQTQPGNNGHNGFFFMAITAEIDDDTRNALISLLATQPDVDFFGVAESRLS